MSMLKRKKLLQIVREFGMNPRVHGNGFIQLDLPDDERLHVWGHPDIPRQKTSTQIHNHKFGFTSQIILGSLVNVRYTFVPCETADAATHKAYTPVPRDREDTELVEAGMVVALRSRIEMFNEGDFYFMVPGEYHETFVNQPTITLMRKTEITTNMPKVLSPLGREPDNDFQRYTAPDVRLWTIIVDTFDC